jgi:hypothetical protein
MLFAAGGIVQSNLQIEVQNAPTTAPFIDEMRLVHLNMH